MIIITLGINWFTFFTVMECNNVIMLYILHTYGIACSLSIYRLLVYYWCQKTLTSLSHFFVFFLQIQKHTIVESDHCCEQCNRSVLYSTSVFTYTSIVCVCFSVFVQMICSQFDDILVLSNDSLSLFTFKSDALNRKSAVQLSFANSADREDFMLI